jgi:hypothetical protein
MTTRRQVLEQQMDRLAAKIAELASRPAEPKQHNGELPVIRFDVRFGGEGLVYHYAALRLPNGRWMTTARLNTHTVFSDWDALLDWLEDKRVGDIWLVESYVKLDG